MLIGLYDASLPVFLRYLDRMLGLVEVAEAHVHSHNLVEMDILGARLAPDMLPFETQVIIAANFALRACFPLAGKELPPYGEATGQFAGLRACVAQTVARLGSLDPAQFVGGESRVLESAAGNTVVSLEAPEFLFQYALPNFFFHISMAYAILRSHGVVLGKAQFDGFHVYDTQDSRGPE